MVAIGRPQSLSTLPPVAKVAHPAPTLEWDTPLFQQAATQLEHALELADVSDMVSQRLRAPERALILTLPVRMDDGSYASFPAYRVQHSSVLGPTLLGKNFNPRASATLLQAVVLPLPAGPTRATLSPAAV